MTKIIDKFPYEVEVTEHLWVSMPDGCRLSAKLWLPVGADQEPVPAILEYIPYRKGDGTANRDQVIHAYFAGHGYAGIRVDMRGTGDSEGIQFDEYLPIEQEDGQAVLTWIASQNWCTGAVGMMGISWGGVAALQAATYRHPALKAILPVCASDDRYYDDGSYYLGCLSGQTIGWGAVMFGRNARPPDPVVAGEGWREQWLSRMSEPPLFLETWLRHQRRDSYWLQGTVQGQYDRIQCPVYAVTGWADCWPNTVLRLLENLPTSLPKKGTIGPWGHAYPHHGMPKPAIGFLQEALRWWDRWLRGMDNGIDQESRLNAYIQERVPPDAGHSTRPGRWVSELQWPNTRQSVKRWFIGNEQISDQPVSCSPVIIKSPLSCGLCSGEYMPWYTSGFSPQLPLDQRDDDARSVVFDGPILDKPLELLGTPSAKLSLTSSAPSGLIVARLCDLWPDGASTLISFGILNLAQREGRESPLPVEPGTCYRVRVRLNDTGYSLAPGHRLRLALSTSYWPIAWPTPDEGWLTLDPNESALELPVYEDSSLNDQILFAEPEHAPYIPTESLRPSHHERTITKNVATGESVLWLVKDAGRQRFSHNQIEAEEATTERYVIGETDPLSARAEYTAHQVVARGNWQTRTESSLTVSCSRELFLLDAKLTAYEGDNEVYSRSWATEIPRDGF